MLNGKALPTFATFIRNTSPGSVGGIPGISLPVGITERVCRSAWSCPVRRRATETFSAIAAAIEPLLPKLPAPPVRA